MVHCCVDGCRTGRTGQAAKDGTKYQSFRFPKKKGSSLWTKWVHQVNHQGFHWTENSVVCEKHFTINDFLPEKDERGRKRLKKGLSPLAFPTLQLTGGVEVKKRVTKTSQQALEKAQPTSWPALLGHMDHDHPFPTQPKRPRLANPNPFRNSDSEGEDEGVPTAAPVAGNNSVPNLDFQVETEVAEDKDQTIANYQALLEEKDQKLAKMGRKLEICERQVACVNKVFNPDQKSRLMNPKSRSPWSDKSLQDSMQTYFTCGTTGYNFLRKRGYPFPDVRTIQRNLAFIKAEPGTQDDILQLMKMKMSSIPERDR